MAKAKKVPEKGTRFQLVRFLYDGLNVMIERDSLGMTQASYTRGLGYGGGIGSIIQAVRGPQRLSYHYDGLGSVMQLTDPTGRMVQAYTYEAFGSLLASRGTMPNAYRYSTKEFSAPSGLIYFGARYYDPKLGRFLTQDPLGMIDGPNRYVYARNNPLSFIDPTGLVTTTPQWEWWDWVQAGDDVFTPSAEAFGRRQRPVFEVGTGGGGGGGAIGAGAVRARFASQSHLRDHFTRHGRGFGTSTPAEYEAQASRFLDTPRGGAGTLEKVRLNGDIVRYNSATEEFGVITSDGTIKTYYKPNPAVHGYPTNLDYFNAQ